MDSNGVGMMEKEDRGTTSLPDAIPTRGPSTIIELEHSSSRLTSSRTAVVSTDPSLNDTEPSHGSSQTESVGMKRPQLLHLIFRRTIAWVGGGIFIMILGIGIFQAALLARIFTCPAGATCDHSYDPNTSMVLQLLQTAMSWWLKIGWIIGSFGMLRLSAYHSRFITVKHGNSVDNIDLTRVAIKGSLLDACWLVHRRGNIIISFLLLGQIAIGAAINLFVGLSIVRVPGERVVPFDYPSISKLPDGGFSQISHSDEQNRAIAKVIGWALMNDTTHGNALKGSLVALDGRSNSSVQAQAGGPRITGSISCTGVSDKNITLVKKDNEPAVYHIMHKGHIYVAYSHWRLSVSMVDLGRPGVVYLWVSNTRGVLPNATNTPDGVMYAALCKHDVFFQDPQEPLPGLQYLQPNTAIVPGCTNQDMGLCIADMVSDTILSWWGGAFPDSFWGLFCRGGVLGSLRVLGPGWGSEGQITPEPLCPLTEDLWVETVTSMLDGMMQSATTLGLDTQSLKANVQSIDSRRWWLQGVIPLMTLLLYFLALWYTCYLSQGNSTLKSLDLEQIISAAQTDHVRELMQSGRLGRSTMRYDKAYTKDL